MAKQDLSPLVLAAQRGDQQALSDLLEASYRDLYFYAYQTVKNEDLAADITQESCLEIISTISQLREPNAFVVWAAGSPTTSAPASSGSPKRSP